MDKKEINRRMMVIENKVSRLENGLPALEDERKSLEYLRNALKRGYEVRIKVSDSYEGQFTIREKTEPTDNPYNRISGFFLDAVEKTLPIVKGEIRARWSTIEKMEEEYRQLEEMEP